MVQPVEHGEDDVSGGAIAGGIEFDNVEHVFDTFSRGETGDASV